MVGRRCGAKGAKGAKGRARGCGTMSPGSRFAPSTAPSRIGYVVKSDDRANVSFSHPRVVVVLRPARPCVRIGWRCLVFGWDDGCEDAERGQRIMLEGRGLRAHRSHRLLQLLPGIGACDPDERARGREREVHEGGLRAVLEEGRVSEGDRVDHVARREVRKGHLRGRPEVVISSGRRSSGRP